MNYKTFNRRMAATRRGSSEEAQVYDDVLADLQFMDPGGRSALRASSRRNPRNLPCPSCGEKNRLTPADRAAGYQCDACADRTEQGW